MRRTADATIRDLFGPTEKKTKKKRPEAAVAGAVERAAALLSYVALWRNTTGAGQVNGQWMRWGLAPGSADHVGILRLRDGRGVFLAVEEKAEGGRLSEVQEKWLQKVRALGGCALVVRSAAEFVEGVQAFRDSQK